MKRSKVVGAIAMLGIAMMVSSVKADSCSGCEAGRAIKSAETALQKARVSIERAKQVVVRIPDGSAEMTKVVAVLAEAKEAWAQSAKALADAKGVHASEANDPMAKSMAVSKARVAMCGSSVVRVALSYTEAVAKGDAASAEQIAGYYAQVKKLFAEASAVTFE